MNRFLLFLIFTSIVSCMNLQKDDDYIILNQLINLKSIPKNDTLYLLEKGKYDMDCLRYYYIYKYDKEKYASLLVKFEKQKRKNIEDGILSEYSKYLQFGFKHVNCVNDNIINKNTLTYMKNQNDSIIWNNNNIDNPSIVISHFKKSIKFDLNCKENYPLISISKPIYNKNRDIAIVSYYLNTNNLDINSNNSTILTYQKKNGEWQLIDKLIHN